jgi:hypothetical protein
MRHVVSHAEERASRSRMTFFTNCAAFRHTPFDIIIHRHHRCPLCIYICLYFIQRRFFSDSDKCRMKGWHVNDELERIWNEAVVTQFQGNFPAFGWRD